MKKYFLKGKEFLTKKLQQLDFQTENIDYVGQQIPNRLRQPLSVLMTQEIDLQPTTAYETYFRNYPTHHISQFLLEKFKTQLQAKANPSQYKLPGQDTAFVPKSDHELQRKALLFKQAIQDYEQGYTKVDDTVLCMCVVHFHHKRGTEIQYSYPQNQVTKQVQENVVHHAMPDSSHNKPEDYNFFNFQAKVKGKKTMLFGVSYFKQIKVTEAMKSKNSQLTRSYIQKAVAIISVLPLFGYMKFRLAVTTKLFFDDFTNFEIVNAAYRDISKHLNETWPKMHINELYIGSDLKVIIDLFGVQPFYEIWKAVLYQRRVVVFAHSSSSASSFILSLLSLFPGMSTFGMFSKYISRYMQALRQYDLPVRIFSSDNFMSMSFHVQDFHLLAPFQKKDQGHFLLGTTNRLLKESNDYGVELLVNLQNCTIQKKKCRIGWQQQSKKEKNFLYGLEQIITSEKNVGYGGSEDCIRNYFHNFLKQQLVDMIQAIALFKQFKKDCSQYAKSHKTQSQTNKTSKKNSYEWMQDQDVDSNERPNPGLNNDFPPLIPRQVTSIPFPSLLRLKSFTHFLQFHNKDLPKIVKLSQTNQQQNQMGKRQMTLRIQNYDYVLQNLQDNQFIGYNIAQKRLYFGKGKTFSFEGKQIRFKIVEKNYKQVTLEDPIPIAKSIFVGLVHNHKYNKNGFYIDENQVYQGDFLFGMKHGYGKLTNPLHKYIGYFDHNLYSGDGQLVTGNSVYVGQFKEGLRHGCGKNQGQELNYDGEWQNDYPHGHGVLIIKHRNEQKQTDQNKQQQLKQDNNQFIGTFIKGKLDQSSQVTIRYPSGAMYKGQVLNKKPHGKGFLVDQNGHMNIGIFNSGRLVQKIQKKHAQGMQNGQGLLKEQNIQKQNRRDSTEQQGQETALSNEKTNQQKQQQEQQQLTQVKDQIRKQSLQGATNQTYNQKQHHQIQDVAQV